MTPDEMIEYTRLNSDMISWLQAGRKAEYFEEYKRFLELKREFEDYAVQRTIDEACEGLPEKKEDVDFLPVAEWVDSMVIDLAMGCNPDREAADYIDGDYLLSLFEVAVSCVYD
ncbi:MAG: hypothetical protein GWO41_03910, partial [candidate division Zixibacteria bacterium]|nr:hypothetical protein [candidate division Zixibacteria bacterium]NIW39778.1 hypothetical protein [candidate division Zixibacteria bacterium]NIX54692.1 hypothetical protein [candidate division Zixibacteria bacterium]